MNPNSKNRQFPAGRAAILAALLLAITTAWMAKRWATNQPRPRETAGESNVAAQLASTKDVALRGWNTGAVTWSDPRAAVLRLAERHRAVVPNAQGEFPRVVVPASAIVEAIVPFTAAAPGETISVQAEDGSVLLEEAALGRVTIDDASRATIRLRTTAYAGMQRVTLRRGGEVRVLEFWIGPEQPVLARK